MLIIMFKHIIRCLQTVSFWVLHSHMRWRLLLHFNTELPDLAVITVKLRHAVASPNF